jgi:hypothetical protein
MRLGEARSSAGARRGLFFSGAASSLGRAPSGVGHAADRGGRGATACRGRAALPSRRGREQGTRRAALRLFAWRTPGALADACARAMRRSSRRRGGRTAHCARRVPPAHAQAHGCDCETRALRRSGADVAAAQEVRVRAGYVPQEEVAKYRPRGGRCAAHVSSFSRRVDICASASGARRSSWAHPRRDARSATCRAARGGGCEARGARRTEGRCRRSCGRARCGVAEEPC